MCLYVVLIPFGGTDKWTTENSLKRDSRGIIGCITIIQQMQYIHLATKIENCPQNMGTPPDTNCTSNLISYYHKWVYSLCANSLIQCSIAIPPSDNIFTPI